MASAFTLFALVIVCHAVPTFLQQTPPYPAPVQPTVPFNDSFGSSVFVALLSTIVVEARDKTFVLTGLLAATKMRRAVACGAIVSMVFLTLVDGLIGYIFVPLIRDRWVNWAAVIAYCAFFWLYLKDWWNFKPQDMPDSLRQPLLDPQGGYQPTNQPADQPPAANCNQDTPGQPQGESQPISYAPTLSKEERRARWLDLSMKTAALIFLGEWSDATMISTSDLSMKNNFWGVQTGCLIAYCITARLSHHNSRCVRRALARQQATVPPTAPAHCDHLPALRAPHRALLRHAAVIGMIGCRRIASRPQTRLMTISPTALQRLQTLMSRQPGAIGVKIGVRRRGCNGLSYTMDYARDIGKLDEVVTEGNMKVVVDAKAVMFLIGTHMDFVTNETKEEFVFTNPNAKGSCGCGESFTVT